MKKVIVLSFLFILSLSITSYADTTTPNKPTIALLYVNNTTDAYANLENKKISEGLAKILQRYNRLPETICNEYLSKASIENFTMADKGDILKAFQDKNIDYVICIEIQSIACTAKQVTSGYGTGSASFTTTAVVPVKIIELKSGFYLFNSKIVETNRDLSGVFNAPSNKSMSLSIIDNVLIRLENLISSKIPS